MIRKGCNRFLFFFWKSVPPSEIYPAIQYCVSPFFLIEYLHSNIIIPNSNEGNLF